MKKEDANRTLRWWRRPTGHLAKQSSGEWCHFVQSSVIGSVVHFALASKWGNFLQLSARDGVALLVAPVQTTNSAICPRCSAGLCVRHDVRTARGWRQRGQWSAQFRRLIPPLDFVILSLLWQKHQRRGTWHTLSASFRFSSSTNENTTLIVGLFPLFVTFHPGARYVRVLVALINGIWVIPPSIALMEKSSRFPH